MLVEPICESITQQIGEPEVIVEPEVINKPEVIVEQKVIVEQNVIVKQKVIVDPILQTIISQYLLIGINKYTVAILIKSVIEAVEDTPLHGSDQKMYANKLIRQVFDELAKECDKDFLLMAVDSGLIGETIDLIISASSGALNINKKIKSSCMQYLSMKIRSKLPNSK